MYKRNDTKKINIGNVTIGGGSPIAIQSMCNTKTSDIDATINQILKLENAGCDIIRVSVPDEESAKAISKIKNKINIPLVADIHFDYKLAILSIENGIDKVRINPGNIGDEENIKKVVDALKKRNISLRIGVNSGSLSKNILNKYDGCVTIDGLFESAKENIELLEKYDFNDIVVSIKASNVNDTIEAYRKFAINYNYPIHIGVTEAGTIFSGTIKSSIALGILLNEGLGDTIRVSLTGDPVEEVKVAKTLLKSLGLKKGIDIISCPTCARTNIDIINIAKKVEDIVFSDKSLYEKNIKVAIMGCAVNGPGEGKNADIGICGGEKEALLMKKGEIIGKIPEDKLIDVLIDEIKKL